MRVAWLVVVAGCTTSSPPVTDRTDCISCHTVPVVGDPVPPTCTAKDHTLYADATPCSHCHGTTAWCPADDKHTAFNITTTSHGGWDCATCHLAVTYDPPGLTDPKAIDCTNCHWHDRARVDPFHLGNGNYTYGPATCLASQCHGGGRRQ